MVLCLLEVCRSLHHQIEAICPLPSLLAGRQAGRQRYDLLECDCTEETMPDTETHPLLLKVDMAADGFILKGVHQELTVYFG